jgi:hypothetical protein
MVSGRTVVFDGGLKKDGWKPDKFVVESSVYIVVVVGGDQGPEPRLRLPCSH